MRPCGLYPTRLFYLRDFPGKSTGVSCRFLLWEFFPTQGSNPASPALAGGFCTTALPGKPTPPSRLFPSTVDFNNIGLNCEGSLTCGNFSVVNSTVLRNLWLVEPIDVISFPLEYISNNPLSFKPLFQHLASGELKLKNITSLISDRTGIQT